MRSKARWPPSYTIRMFGGTVEGETMEVTDTPRFKVGDRDILFVETQRQAIRAAGRASCTGDFA